MSYFNIIYVLYKIHIGFGYHEKEVKTMLTEEDVSSFGGKLLF